MSDFKLLIVDDEEDLRDVLEHQLRNIASVVRTAENGRVALKMLRDDWFDAVLSDISMPEMTGLELLANLRQEGIEVPFIILTGFGDKAKAVEALRLGAFDFLEKPWDASQLRTAVAAALEVGQRLRGVEDEIETLIRSAGPMPAEQQNRLREAHRAMLLMRAVKPLSKKTGS